MKIVHISKDDCTGAGVAALRTHCALLQQKVDSKMLVFNKKSNVDKVFQVKGLLHRILHYYDRVCYRFPFLNLMKTDHNRVMAYSREIGGYCSSPYSRVDLSTHPAVKEADIIHVHWANGFLDYRTFFEQIKKPIVFTIHDENFFMGACHHHSVYNPKSEIEKEYYEIKKCALEKISNLTLIMLSKSFYEKFKTHEFLKKARVEIIPNCINTEVFRPYDKEQVRRELGLPLNYILFSFVGNLSDKHKGLHYIVEALDLLQLENAMVLAIGPNINAYLHSRLISVGSVLDEHLMARYLSASDYYVLSSVQESFSQSAIESQACGVPGIMFPVGVAPELIRDFNGVLCEFINAEALAKSIKLAMSRKYDRRLIQYECFTNYSTTVVASALKDLYVKLLRVAV